MRICLLPILTCLPPIALMACAGSAASTRPAPTTATTTSPSPAPASTPAEAMLRAYEALAAGDEPAYRRAVIFRPPSAYAEALARSQLASARLHRAVRAHGVTGKRVRDAGFDVNETLIVNEPPSGKQLQEMRDALRTLEWKVAGNVARPFTGPENPPGPWVERHGDGWILIATDAGADADAGDLRRIAEGTGSLPVSSTRPRNR